MFTFTFYFYDLLYKGPLWTSLCQEVVQDHQKYADRSAMEL